MLAGKVATEMRSDRHHPFVREINRRCLREMPCVLAPQAGANRRPRLGKHQERRERTGAAVPRHACFLQWEGRLEGVDRAVRPARREERDALAIVAVVSAVSASERNPSEAPETQQRIRVRFQIIGNLETKHD